MAFQFDEGHIYDGQLLVCPENVIPTALGIGPQKIIGSSYIQGPLNVGSTGFPFPPPATVMIGPRVDAGPSSTLTGSICGSTASNLSLYVK